jgi:hypothetical protein
VPIKLDTDYRFLEWGYNIALVDLSDNVIAFRDTGTSGLQTRIALKSLTDRASHDFSCKRISSLLPNMSLKCSEFRLDVL